MANFEKNGKMFEVESWWLWESIDVLPRLTVTCDIHGFTIHFGWLGFHGYADYLDKGRLKL